MRRDGPREQQNQNDIAKKQQQKDQEKNQRGIERERVCIKIIDCIVDHI